MGQLRSEIAWSDESSSTVRGRDLCDDIIGHLSLTDLLVLELQSRVPSDLERRMLDALLVAIAEHGVTPSVIAARMTLLGSPESLQGAVAAGLLGAGSVYLGTMEQTAEMLHRALDGRPNGDLDAIAAELVRDRRAAKRIIPGIGHPIHTGGDPRTKRLSDLAGELGFFGQHSRLLNAVADHAAAELNRSMPVNAAGAVGAIAADMGFDSRIIRGFGVAARAVGLLGHLFEEIKSPIAPQLWSLVADSVEH